MNFQKWTLCCQKNGNLNTNEKASLNTLKNNPYITIKKADKGSSVVIMNTVDYVRECYRQLADSHFYIENDTDLTGNYHSEIQSFIKELETSGVINKKVAATLKQAEARTPHFYICPRSIKRTSPADQSWVQTTVRQNAFLDCWTAFYVCCYIRDTTDFINKVENLDLGRAGDDAILFSMDVTSLYTNIPPFEGIDCTLQMLSERPPCELPLPVISKLLELVLTRNTFQFNGHYFIQKNGVAMGTCVAPTFANVYLHVFESKLLQNAAHKPLIWYRYIDDMGKRYGQTI